MSPSFFPTRPERVLIVEDDPGLNQLLADEVSDHALDVRTTSSLEEARYFVTNWEPDLVVSDLDLSQKSALDLLRETRSSAHRTSLDSAPFARASSSNRMPILRTSS